MSRPEPGYDDSEPSSEDLARIATAGGSFDWLDEEPDTYREDQGDAYTLVTRPEHATDGADTE